MKLSSGFLLPVVLLVAPGAAAWDGSVDPSYGSGGSNSEIANIFAMRDTVSGDLLVLRQSHLEKLSPNGLTIASLELGSPFSSIIEMPDGAIALSRISGGTYVDHTVEVCRVNPDLTEGAWQSSNSYCVSAPLPNFTNQCRVVTSTVTLANQLLVGGNCPDSFIVAFTMEGAIDTRFNGGLLQHLWNSAGDILVMLVGEPDRMGVMVGGSALVIHENADGTLRQDLDFAVAALDQFGNFSSSFAITGRRTLGFDDVDTGAASSDALAFLGVEPRRIVLIGTSDETLSSFGIKRFVALHRDGSRDLSFGASNATTSVSNAFSLQAAAGNAQSGYVVTGRTGYYPFSTSCAAMRVTGNGAQDMSFGSPINGYSYFAFPDGPLYKTCGFAVMQGNRPIISESTSFGGEGSAIGRLSTERILIDSFDEVP